MLDITQRFELRSPVIEMSNDGRLEDYGVRSSSYGKHVRTYSDSRLYEQMLEPLRQLDLRECEVLDLGSGTGLSSVHLRGEVKSIYYLDYSTEMISEGIKRGTVDASKVIIHDFARESLPFPGESFDIVIARYCIHDVRDKLRLFTETSRILRADGLFQMVDMYAVDELSKEFYNRVHGWKTRSEVPVETFIDSLETYNDLMRESAMTVICITYYRSIVHTSEWVLENQVTEERRRFIDDLALREGRANPALNSFFGMETRKDTGLCIQFPVVIMTARKEPST